MGSGRTHLFRHSESAVETDRRPGSEHGPPRNDPDDLLERRPPLFVRRLDVRLAVELEQVEKDELEVEVVPVGLLRVLRRDPLEVPGVCRPGSKNK